MWTISCCEPVACGIEARHHGLQPTFKAVVNPADAACCGQLAAINFQSQLPVVIVDTHSVNVTRNATSSQICTCSQGLERGDINTTGGFRIRGGTNSREHQCIEPASFLLMPRDLYALEGTSGCRKQKVHSWQPFERQHLFVDSQACQP